MTSQIVLTLPTFTEILVVPVQGIAGDLDTPRVVGEVVTPRVAGDHRMSINEADVSRPEVTGTVVSGVTAEVETVRVEAERQCDGD